MLVRAEHRAARLRPPRLGADRAWCRRPQSPDRGLAAPAGV